MKKFLIHYSGFDSKCKTHKRKIEDYFIIERGSIGAVTRYLNELGADNTKGLTFNVYDVTLTITKDIEKRLNELTIIKTYQF